MTTLQRIEAERRLFAERVKRILPDGYSEKNITVDVYLHADDHNANFSCEWDIQSNDGTVWKASPKSMGGTSIFLTIK